METKWRLIDSGPCDAFYNMAFDEAIATEARKGSAPPTLRLYGWDRASVTLGSFQKASDINIEYCRLHDIPIVRRPTGGRAILHGDELTYSFSSKTDNGPFSHGLLDSYKRISMAFLSALRKIGVKAEQKKESEKGRVLSRSPLCFQSSSYGEILIENRKLVGSAQKRWKDGLLQQGSIPYTCDKEKIVPVFGRKVSHTENSLHGLKEIVPDFDDQNFRKALREAFEETFGISLLTSHPDPAEHQLAEELEQRKYLQESWNLRL